MSYKEVSSSDEECEAAQNITVSHASMMHDGCSKDNLPEKTKVKDSPDLDIFAFKMERGPTEKEGEKVAETFTNGPLKCYSRKTRFQSVVKPVHKLESKEDVHAHDGEQRSQSSNRAAKNLKESSSDEDGSDAGRRLLLYVLLLGVSPLETKFLNSAKDFYIVNLCLSLCNVWPC